MQLVHVEDAALALFRLLKLGLSGVYNVAPEEALSLDDLERLTGLRIMRASPGLVRALRGPGRLLGLDRLAGVDDSVWPLLTGRALLANRKLRRDAGFRFKYASSGALAAHLEALKRS